MLDVPVLSDVAFLSPHFLQLSLHNLSLYSPSIFAGFQTYLANIVLPVMVFSRRPYYFCYLNYYIHVFFSGISIDFTWRKLLWQICDSSSPFFNSFCEEIMKCLIHASTFVNLFLVWNGTSYNSHNSTLG